MNGISLMGKKKGFDDPTTKAWAEMEKNANEISLNVDNPKHKKLFDW